MTRSFALPLFSSKQILLPRILFSILFFGWVNLRKLRWVTFAERRRLTSGAFPVLGKEEINPESLLAQARKLQDIWTDGTPAVKVQTEIEILDAKGKTVSGRYVVIWISPSRWSEELEIANYKRIRVHDLKGYRQQSTLSVNPKSFFNSIHYWISRLSSRLSPSKSWAR
jgi:hypothetical protein